MLVKGKREKRMKRKARQQVQYAPGENTVRGDGPSRRLEEPEGKARVVSISPQHQRFIPLPELSFFSLP